MGNNFRRLKEEADIDAVVEYLGIQKFSKGANIFIHCPLPGHDDKRPTNCYYKPGWNNLYCQRCGKSIKAIDLIMYTAGLEYGAAADALWEIEGRPEWYYEKKQKNGREIFSLSGKEANIIGIHLPHKIEKFVCLYDEKPVNKNKNFSWAISDSEWIENRWEQLTWQDFMTEHDFKQLVIKKCNERLHLFKSIEARFSRTLSDEWKHVIPELFAEERRIALDVKKRASKDEMAG